MTTSCTEFFKDKRVTLLGLGVLGRGVGDAQFLAECGARVLVTDMKSEEALGESVARLRQYKNVSFHLGGHREEDFTSADMVIKAAGARKDSPYIGAAQKAGVPVYMSTALAAKFVREAGAKVIGVTGTRGKSTVTQMIHHTLKQSALRQSSGREKQVFLGGNVRGVSTLALVPEVQAGDYLVLELDSWQLQGFGDLKMSPQIAVFTNLMPDHQNYYSSMGEYFNDKANIFLFQEEGDTLIAGRAVADEWINEVRAKIPSSYSGSLKVLGAHNRENAALAAEALRSLGISDDEIFRGLETFESLEGRLQLVGEVRGIKIYNDNNATTPAATMAALRALGNEKKNIILIIGGSDKGLDASELLYEIAKACKRVICLAGTGTSRITPFMSDFSLYDNLEEAVHEAVRSATLGDVILFSPAFASFGMFKNEYERNDQFLLAVHGATKMEVL